MASCKALNFQFITKRTLSWTNDPIKILGIWVHQNFNVIYEYNFGPILNKCEVILNSWQHRGLTTMGRICIANSLIASLLSQKLAVLPMPDENFFKKYKKIVLDFIWKKGMHKVQYEN